MRLFEYLRSKLNDDLELSALFRLVLVFVLIWLLMTTSGFLMDIFRKVWSVLQPFAIGFFIAFAIRPLIRKAEEKGISPKISIPLLYAAVLVFFVWILSTIVPTMIARASGFLDSIVEGLGWIRDLFRQIAGDNAGFLPAVSDQLMSWLSGMNINIGDILGSTMNVFIRVIFTIIISLFMAFEWNGVTAAILRIARRFGRRTYAAVLAVSDEIGDYIRSLLVLMLIRFFEYSIVYLVCGHPDWLILAVLTSISLLIPYLGPTVVNTAGILSALTTPKAHVVLLIILILILSNTDEYVISPLVHSRNTHITPLWALFSIFAGSTLFGVTGIIIAIPVYLAIHTILHMDQEAEE
ncbi:MAG: AI-2E family transporter [Solobacterium sp.]|nr:AI-2E family transporter [Solobacterium sp.]